MNTFIEKPAQRSPSSEETSFLLPPTNILETNEAFIIESEMPGVNPTGLEVTLNDNTLTLTGRRELELPKAHALYVESKPAHFRRIFELDPSTDSSRITARLEQGLLTLTLPKAEQVKPRRIAVGD